MIKGQDELLLQAIEEARTSLAETEKALRTAAADTFMRRADTVMIPPMAQATVLCNNILYILERTDEKRLME